jgi:hypothetical protein
MSWYLVGIMEDIFSWLMIQTRLPIWSFSSNGKYSVQSLYAVINHHGNKPVFVHAVWKENPSHSPRVQIFLWLLSKRTNA